MPEIFILPLIAAALAALTCGSVGTLTLVRHNTYVAGAVSHTVLAGLGLAQYLSVVHGISWFTPTLGALLAAVLSAFIVTHVRQKRHQTNDAVLSAIWVIGMALGICFMSLTPGYQSDLMNYLFGSILLVSMNDIWVMLGLNVIIILTFTFCWRGILSISFNSRLATIRGVKTYFFEMVLAILTAVAVVLLVKIVGILLVIALLTLPAMSARHFCRRLVPMMFCAIIFTFISIALGLWASWHCDIQPAALIVLAATLISIPSSLKTAICSRK